MQIKADVEKSEKLLLVDKSDNLLTKSDQRYATVTDM